MAVASFEELRRHVGHKIGCAVYGNDSNVAVECETCSEVLLDFNVWGEEDESPEAGLMTGERLGKILGKAFEDWGLIEPFFFTAPDEGSEFEGTHDALKRAAELINAET